MNVLIVTLIMTKMLEKWMANVIKTIDTESSGTESEQVINESIKAAKERKYSKSNPYEAEI